MAKVYTKFFEYLNNEKYKEIEFVCYNSESDSSTDKKSQKNLYEDLKKLEIKSDFKIKPYIQDFSHFGNPQISLSVVILDKKNEKYWENKINKLADKHKVKIDLYNSLNNNQVDYIIKNY